MKQTETKGIYREKNRIFTENPRSCKGIKVYNEKLTVIGKKEFRSWNPYRSKLAAAILKGLKFNIEPNDQILYLGAATGTTVSHISDIARKGIIYAIESSPVAVHELIKVSEKRINIIPVLGDANHPDRYSNLISPVDFIYQDISQRNQAEIFIANLRRYLKKNGTGILIVKARSIDVSLPPKQAYHITSSKIKESGLKVFKTIDLTPYEKDHAALVVTF